MLLQPLATRGMQVLALIRYVALVLLTVTLIATDLVQTPGPLRAAGVRTHATAACFVSATGMWS